VLWTAFEGYVVVVIVVREGLSSHFRKIFAASLLLFVHHFISSQTFVSHVVLSCFSVSPIRT
jgi:hypothetical protein